MCILQKNGAPKDAAVDDCEEIEGFLESKGTETGLA
jgi:hypothetical protein